MECKHHCSVIFVLLFCKKISLKSKSCVFSFKLDFSAIDQQVFKQTGPRWQKDLIVSNLENHITIDISNLVGMFQTLFTERCRLEMTVKPSKPLTCKSK